MRRLRAVVNASNRTSPGVSAWRGASGVEQVAKSDQIKEQANKKFQENHLTEAIELYTEAIEHNPTNHVLYANRAFCHIKLENYGHSRPASRHYVTSLHFAAFPHGSCA